VVWVGLGGWGRVVDCVDVDVEEDEGGMAVVVVVGVGGAAVAVVVGGTAADASEPTPTVVEVDEPTRLVPDPPTPAPPDEEDEPEDDPKTLLLIASCFTLPIKRGDFKHVDRSKGDHYEKKKEKRRERKERNIEVSQTSPNALPKPPQKIKNKTRKTRPLTILNPQKILYQILHKPILLCHIPLKLNHLHQDILVVPFEGEDVGCLG
jgi:hypothetical protein